MILIFGGTTEGRIAAAVCDGAAKEYLYATKGEDQRLVAYHAQQICGAMDTVDIEGVMSLNKVELIIDAAHPYAEILHKNITQAAELTSTPVVRFERLCCESSYDKIIYFDSLLQVVEHIKSEGISDVVALTGVKSAATFAPIAESHRVTLRIMDREDSQQLIERSHFPVERVIYYDLMSDNNYVIDQNIGAIVTKESGESGGYHEKICLAESLGVPLLVVRRPALPEYSSTVYGEYGLRREIEQILPKYFALKTGFTTGSAATAAATAALKSIISEQSVSAIEIMLPNGEPYAVPIHSVERCDGRAMVSVMKDGGDDVDATHNIEIIAIVDCRESSETTITISGGIGVGRVTLPGIGIEVGEAAINPVPQQMIRQNILRVLDELNMHCDVDVEIYVPEGGSVAKKTFNPRLGIVDGISILGTSGIVQPFSAEAFLESIARQVDIVRALGGQMIVINSGARSERYIKARYPDLPPQCFIHYGNLIGETIKLASRCGIRHIVLGVMLGKAVKLATGALDTHSKRVVLDREFIAKLARKVECSEDIISKIEKLTTARQLWDLLPSDHPLFAQIKVCCYSHTHPLLPEGSELEIVLISERGELV